MPSMRNSDFLQYRSNLCKLHDVFLFFFSLFTLQTLVTGCFVRLQSFFRSSVRLSKIYIKAHFSTVVTAASVNACTSGSRGGRGHGFRTPLENHKNIGFLSNNPDPLKNHKATKPAFNVGPSFARQPNAILNGLSLAGR